MAILLASELWSCGCTCITCGDWKVCRGVIYPVSYLSKSVFKIRRRKKPSLQRLSKVCEFGGEKSVETLQKEEKKEKGSFVFSRTSARPRRWQCTFATWLSPPSWQAVEPAPYIATTTERSLKRHTAYCRRSTPHQPVKRNGEALLCCAMSKLNHTCIHFISVCEQVQWKVTLVLYLRRRKKGKKSTTHQNWLLCFWSAAFEFIQKRRLNNTSGLLCGKFLWHFLYSFLWGVSEPYTPCALLHRNFSDAPCSVLHARAINRRRDSVTSYRPSCAA